MRPPREERKVVTVLFADLVGFTARSEKLDPEDVRALLAPYHAHLRSELERFGGTVEKFIGDAVMALFGAPIAHEDDPERAVRAALAIRDWAPRAGGGAAGADRGQHGRGPGRARRAAERGRGDGCRRRRQHGRATAGGRAAQRGPRRRADLSSDGRGDRLPRGGAGRRRRERRSRSASGRRSRHARASAWTSRGGADTPLVGRGRELELAGLDARARARGALAPARHARRRPGDRQEPARRSSCSGRSRRIPSSSRWRQGRSLPYGEGVTFWALAEIVKAEAGILENDTSEQAEEKLVRAVGSASAPTRRSGSGSSGTCGRWPASRRKSPPGPRRAFAAWRRFLEALAEERPLVLVFEDLHWADDALLEFVDQLVERVSGVPLLVLGTARPELLERRPGWGGGKPNALIDLALAALRRGDGTPRPGAARPAADRCPDSGGAARPGRGQPALCGAVRPHPARAWRPLGAAGDGAGDHRRPAGRPVGGREAAPAGRGRRRQGVLAGSRRGDRQRHQGGRPRSCCSRSSARSSSARSRPRRSPARASTRSATC